MKVIGTRADDSVVERIDALVPEVKRMHHGAPTTRSDVVRVLVELGLRQLEEQAREAAQ